MEIPKSQHTLMHCLKTRGPQSVKILSSQLDMTTMGVRQHLAELERRTLVRKSRERRQNRGRPVQFWELTSSGHGQFADGHGRLAVDLIAAMRDSLGEDGLAAVVSHRSGQLAAHYRQRLAGTEQDLPRRLQLLAQLRSEEGFMAEVRLVPEGWLFIENHCPISAAAGQCASLCHTELETFRQLLAPRAELERVDHLLDGARRCAYRITARA